MNDVATMAAVAGTTISDEDAATLIAGRGVAAALHREDGAAGKSCNDETKAIESVTCASLPNKNFNEMYATTTFERLS